MNTTGFVGNIKSKEFHNPDCFCVNAMHETNKILLNSIKQAIDHGYDPCGHCLGKLDESEESLDIIKKESVTKHFFGHFYGVFNGTSANEYSGIEVRIGDKIELFAKLHTCIFENNEWKYLPVENHKIDIICKSIDFLPQKTDANGFAKWSYKIPRDFEPGTTTMRIDFNLNENLVLGAGDCVSFTLPVGISNIRVFPNPFNQETKIFFNLNYDKRIKADIYKNTYFQNSNSHVKNLRNFNDGIIKASENASLDWDGTTDHGFREGKPVMKGKYVVKIEGEYGKSDTEFKENLIKTGGVLESTNPEPNQPTEYISDIIFSPNPFTTETNVKLDFFLQKDAEVSIHIQHVNWKFRGKCTREILKNVPLKKGAHSTTWDGRNNRGNRVTLGEYKVRILANGNPFVKENLSLVRLK